MCSPEDRMYEEKLEMIACHIKELMLDMMLEAVKDVKAMNEDAIELRAPTRPLSEPEF